MLKRILKFSKLAKYFGKIWNCGAIFSNYFLPNRDISTKFIPINHFSVFCFITFENPFRLPCQFMIVIATLKPKHNNFKWGFHGYSRPFQFISLVLMVSSTCLLLTGHWKIKKKSKTWNCISLIKVKKKLVTLILCLKDEIYS